MPRFTLAICAAALMLSACTTPPISGGLSIGAPDAQTSLKNIANFTVADLAAADEIAVAQGDLIGHTCYPALTKFVTDAQQQLGGSGLTVKGAFSGFESARVTFKSVKGGLTARSPVPDYLVIGCAPLVQDTIADQAVFLAELAKLGL